MFIQQFYTKCLSESAYYIESNGEVAIIDPLRDIEPYIQLAKERNSMIKYIFETHFHADFVSGHLDLSSKTNAPIIYGPFASTAYKIYNAEDNEQFKLGEVSIKALHTPGHTMESTCYLLLDNKGKEHAIFTGDTLFVGDVGRPDLFGGKHTKEHLAALLYQSLQTKIKPLQDDVLVYPAHGAGSSCGKNIGSETFSTIGEQKANNYAFANQTVEEFVEILVTGLNEPPTYFPVNAKINQDGYDSLDIVLENSKRALSVAEFKAEINDKTILLDTRTADQFTDGFIPSSIFIGLDGRFAEWAGTLIPNNKRILLIAENDKIEESIIRLSRVGLDNVIGYLDGGFTAWQIANEKIDMIINVDVDELAMDLKFDEKLTIIDVRKEMEYNNGHLEGAELLPLQQFMDPFNLAIIEEDENVYVHCAGGYRSVIASSIMKMQGYHNLRNILGGWDSIKQLKELPLVKELPNSKN